MSIIIGESKEGARPEKSVNKEIKKVSFHHQRAINELLQAITLCPMDVELKSILRMIIWGKNPAIFAPMSHADIAIDLKCQIKDVKKWEADALYNVEQFLKRTGIIDIAGKFNRDGEIKKLINPS